MPPSGPDPPPPWPPAVREFVRGEQEDAYRRLAYDLKMGGDPAAAFARLSPGPSALPPQYANFQPPTDYEPAANYLIMSLALGGLKDVWRGPGTPVPYLASLPSGDVNARVVTERKTGAPVIFFEQGLMRFLHHFAKLVAWAVPPLSDAQLYDAEALTRTPRSYTMPFVASQSFVGVLCAYVAAGTASAAKAPVPEPLHNMAVATTVLGLMERFVIAHEVAHLALGHLARPQSPDQEFEADALGLAILLRAARPASGLWAVSFWACDLALTCFHILNRAIAALAFGGRKLRWASQTHPDDLSRRQRLRDTVAGLDPDRPRAGLAAAGELCGMSDALILGRLGEFATVPLLLAHENGDRPSPLWRNRTDYYFQPA